MLNIAYVVGEAACGVLGQSVALLADAGHNLGDVLALAAAWAARHLARRPPKGRYTYGLRGASILAALGNAVVLLVITGGVAGEAVQRLWAPGEPASTLVIGAALAGVAVNGVTAWLFAAGRHGDLNLRGAFWHMAADAGVSLGVAIAGGLILLTGWRVLDPVASLLVSAVIVWGSWSLLRQALDMALQAAPPGVAVEDVRAALMARPGVAEVHDLHVWAMSTTEWALTAHLVRPGAPADDAFLRAACDDLNTRFGIGHSTLQVEDGAAHCPQAPAAAV